MSDKAAIRERVRERIREACHADDVELLKDIVSPGMADDEGEGHSIMSGALHESVEAEAVKVTKFLITYGGAEVAWIDATELVENRRDRPMIKTDLVDGLLEVGWDINHRKCDRRPLLWLVLGDDNSVEWCLERGAAVSPPPLYKTRRGGASSVPGHRLQLLDHVVGSRGSLETFKRLHTLGAPLRRRCLNRAVLDAADPRLDRARAEESMRMVRYIVVECDMSVEPPKGPALNLARRPNADTLISPLVSCFRARDYTLQVLWFLLERGAVPTTGMVADAKSEDFDTSQFLEIVEPLAVEGESVYEDIVCGSPPPLLG